jgi:hypothetical protein
MLLDLTSQYCDLLVRQSAAGILREGRHRRPPNSLCDHVPQLLLSNQSEEEWIVQWTRRAKMAISPVATSAITLVKSGKI